MRRKTIPGWGGEAVRISTALIDSETSAISEFSFHDHFTWKSLARSCGGLCRLAQGRPTEKYAIMSEELHSRAVRS